MFLSFNLGKTCSRWVTKSWVGVHFCKVLSLMGSSMKGLWDDAQGFLEIHPLSPQPRGCSVDVKWSPFGAILVQNNRRQSFSLQCKAVPLLGVKAFWKSYSILVEHIISLNSRFILKPLNTMSLLLRRSRHALDSTRYCRKPKEVAQYIWEETLLGIEMMTYFLQIKHSTCNCDYRS